MTKNQSYWLHKLATLKIDRARGDPAPHKPFLLLVILEMADRGELTGPELPLSPDLAFRFSLFNLADTYALTGYRMTTLDMESIVDAAHIHEFSDSRNNDPRNGLALSKNAHWQFDRGLWCATDDYRVMVNRDRFIEEGVPGQKLADFDGHRLFLPSDSKYWPEPTRLAWHREHRFRPESSPRA